MEKRRKRAKILLLILTIMMGILIVNKERIRILNRNEKIINQTIEIREKLLKEESKKEIDKIKGRVIEEETGKEVINKEIGIYKKEEEGYKKERTEYTDSKGEYEIKNLEEGTYVIKVEDKEYKTKLEEIQIKEGEEKEEEIKVEKEEEFKAEIKKYIKEIKINNEGKEEKYTYENKEKVNIPIKNMKTITGEITYEFKITNKTEKEGYVKIIKDILPEGLSFSEEKNKEWKEKEGKLYTKQISKEKLKKGETRAVRLILDIEKTSEAKRYINKVSITGEVYNKVEYIDGENIYKTISVLEGDTIVEEEGPTKEGYIFKGWYKDKELTKKYDFSEPIIKDTKIYAGYKKEIKVRYIIGEKVYKEEKQEEGEVVKKIENPNIEGYTFKGWYKDKELTEEYDFKEEITKDTDIYGKIEKDEEEKVIITYYIDKEVNGEIEKIKKGERITERKIEEKEGYKFSGWYKDEELTEKYDFNEPIDKDTNIYGKMIKNTYKVTYKIKDKNNKWNIWIEETNKEQAENKIGPEKEEEEKEGRIITYQFEKWYKEEELINEYNFEEKLTEDIELYGKYIEGKVCITRETKKIPTKEEIINKIQTNDLEEIQIEERMEDEQGEYVIANGFKARYIDESKTSYQIIDYTKEEIPEEIKVPDLIEGKPVVKIIGAFQGKEIKTIKISKTLRNITGSFQGTTIDKIDFREAISLEEITDGSFTGSTIKDLDFGNSVNLVAINNGSFMTSTIENLNFNNAVNLTTITNGSFTNGTIKSLKFGNTLSLESLDSGVFTGTTINNIDFGNAVNISTINPGIFTKLDVDVLDLTSLLSYKYINPGVFNGAENKIRKLILGDGVTIINELAFSNVSLESIDFECGNNYEHIMKNTFSNNNIREVEIKNMKNLVQLNLLAFSENPIELFTLKSLPELLLVPGKNNEGEDKKYSTESYDLIIDDLDIVNFSAQAYENENIKNLIIKNSNFVSISSELFRNSTVENVVIENLPNLTTIEMQAFENATRLKKVTLKDLPKFSEIAFYAFKNCSQLEDIEMINVPLLRAIRSQAFEGDKLSYLDLSGLTGLETIENNAFNNNPIKKIRIPNGVTEIMDNAFKSTDTIECIEIMGDSARFNNKWEVIGFPSNISPSTCIFTENKSMSMIKVLGNIMGIQDKEKEKKYNIVLYKMDDNTIIEDEKEYIIEKLEETGFKKINIKEEIEDVGRYKIEEGNDKIKPFNNKVYLTEISEGAYRLVEEGNKNKVLTFIIETTGTVTGNAKINNVAGKGVMSSSQAEVITTIQTGGSRNLYLLVLIPIISMLYILFIYQKKKNN